MPRRGTRRRRSDEPEQVAIDRSPPWLILFYRAADVTVPARLFLDSCPGRAAVEYLAVLDAVAAAPPPQFSGGGKWEAMHGDMTGYYEVRITGPGREQFRLFCLLENGTDDELRRRGLPKPAITVLDRRSKLWRTVLTAADYRAVREFGDNHRGQYPRRVGT